MKFAVAPGFANAEGWLQSMKDAFDMLYAEGARSPKMMSVGIHCRLGGRPEPRADPGPVPRLRRVQAQGLGRHPRADRPPLDEGPSRARRLISA